VVGFEIGANSKTAVKVSEPQAPNDGMRAIRR